MAKIKEIDLRKVIKIFAILWFLATVVVMTITNIGFDDKWNWSKWLSNFLIVFGIMVFGLIMGESVGKDRQENNKEGLFQTSLREYNDYMNIIDTIKIYFSQFFIWYMPQELRNKKIEYLISNNVEGTKAQRIVDYCDISDFELLTKGAIIKLDKNGKEIPIRKLTEDEKIFVEQVLKGEIKLDTYSSSYYLSAFNDDSSSASILEVGKRLDQKKNKSKWANRLIKIITSMLVSIVISVLTVKEFMNGGDVQAWLNLITRVCALITSLLSGWLGAVILVKLSAEQLINKRTVLIIFKNSMDTKLFVPKSEDELANEEIKKEQEELEKARANVIIPEIVEDNKIKELQYVK